LLKNKKKWEDSEEVEEAEEGEDSEEEEEDPEDLEEAEVVVEVAGLTLAEVATKRMGTT